MHGDNNSANTSQLLLTSLSLFLVFNCPTRSVLGRPFVCLSCLSVCNFDVLWPNGCVDQDATWNGGRPWPRRHCVTWGPSSRQERDRVALHFLPMSLRPMSIVAKRSPISATAELLFVTAFVTDLYRQCWAYHGCVQFRPVYRYDTLMTLYSYIYGRPM